MPRGGSKPGERRGGRQRGTLNHKTQDALLEQAMVASTAVKSGKKLAKEVLDEFMHLTAGMAAFYQPTPPDSPQKNVNENEGKFWQCVDATYNFAKELAKYQSPTFKAIAVMAPPEQLPAGPDRPSATVTNIDDPEALQRVYKRRIGQVV